MTAAQPPAARRRIGAGRGGPWVSAVGPAGDAALRSVGFEPVGVVTASVVSWPFAYRFPRRMWAGPWTHGAGVAYAGGPRDDVRTCRLMGGWIRDHQQDGSTVGLQSGGFSWQLVVREERHRQLLAAALDQLRTQAGGLDAAAVVGIGIERVRRPLRSPDETPIDEIRATGTAVRCGAVPPARPCTTFASGAQVAQMLRAGLAPVEAVVGVGCVHADLSGATGSVLRAAGNGEVRQWSDATTRSHRLAIDDAERRAGAHGDLVVGCATEERFERITGAGIEVETRVSGTAVRRFAAPSGEAPQRIMPLR